MRVLSKARRTHARISARISAKTEKKARSDEAKAVLSFVFLALASGCSSARRKKGKRADPSLEQYVLPSVPAGVQNRTFVDFGGAVHLLGWDLDPADQAKPGSRLKLKLYWRSVNA